MKPTFFFLFFIPLLSVLESTFSAAHAAATCERLSLNQAKGDLENTISDLEKSLKTSDTALFLSLLHPSIILKEEEKESIFKQMMESYELRGKTLQRNRLLKLAFGKDTGRTVRCRDAVLKGVAGPTEQWALELSTVVSGEQARLFFLFAPVPQPLRKKSKHPIAITHINTQKWTFLQKTPEAWAKEAKKWSNLEEPVAAWVLGETALKLAQANPYHVRDIPSLDALAHETTTQKAQALFEQFIGKKIAGTEFTLISFTSVFKEDGPQLGVKLEMKQEVAVNDQIEQCRKVAVELAPLFKGMRRKLRGVECLMYYEKEPKEKQPHSGSVFQDISEALQERARSQSSQ